MMTQDSAKKVDPKAAEDFYAGFDQMPDDDLGENVPARQTPSRFEKRAPTDRAETLYSEECSKCRGKGYIGAYGFRDQGLCYQCNGKGVLTFKQPKAKRDAAKIKAAERKEAKLAKNLSDFEAANPDIAEWWTNTEFDFALNLRDSVRRFGSLTDRQLAAAQKCVVKLAEAKATKTARVEAAPVVNVSAIADAFDRARNKGIKKPKMRMLAGEERIEFSRAPDHGQNAGALYVKSRDTDAYLGKVLGGKFHRSRECTDALESGILEVCRAPLEAAVAYGRMLGECSICGRTLTDPESIARGIGPICADNAFGM